jgi:hypothetical protein
MSRNLLPRLLKLAPLLILATTTCSPDYPEMIQPEGTPELRRALFDTILAMTARREAFSRTKQQRLKYEPLQEMGRLRDAVVSADTEEELFYALARLSNARRDRHLSVGLVPLGVRPEFADGVESWGEEHPTDPLQAPVKIRPDFGVSGPAYFVAEVAEGEAAPAQLSAGDMLVSVNGVPVTALETSLTPYVRHSTISGLRWKLAELLTRASAVLPPAFLEEVLELEVEGPAGVPKTESLPYLPP